MRAGGGPRRHRRQSRRRAAPRSGSTLGVGLADAGEREREVGVVEQRHRPPERADRERDRAPRVRLDLGVDAAVAAIGLVTPLSPSGRSSGWLRVSAPDVAGGARCPCGSSHGCCSSPWRPGAAAAVAEDDADRPPSGSSRVTKTRSRGPAGRWWALRPARHRRPAPRASTPSRAGVGRHERERPLRERERGNGRRASPEPSTWVTVSPWVARATLPNTAAVARSKGVAQLAVSTSAVRPPGPAATGRA